MLKVIKTFKFDNLPCLAVSLSTRLWLELWSCLDQTECLGPLLDLVLCLESWLVLELPRYLTVEPLLWLDLWLDLDLEH